MITLYHCMSARSFRPLWILEELGIPYELVVLPFPPRYMARSFLDTNPLGTVPLLVHGSTQMTESAGMCQYLCSLVDGTELKVRPGEEGYGAYLNYLHFGEATLTFPQTLLLRYGRFEPQERRQTQVVEDYTRWFLARLATLEPLLSESPYVAAGRFTAADVSVGYALMLAEHLDLAGEFTPSVSEYWGRLQGRAAYQRALQSQRQAAEAQGVSTKPAPDTVP
ncbi:glutathione S-transferase family protein [Gilvimarinus sp. F26214L]|uniref:glutathione S-transferase family protein n=1 Tax=Gilvimarinus sp. DZF01 TaxID=3461371 RepID=UPI0040456859